jgi:hypothetical protein
VRALITSIIMPRTTLNLDASVLRDLRRRGIQERKSMGRVASELLAATLAHAAAPAVAPPFTWKSGDLGAARVHLAGCRKTFGGRCSC